MKRKLEEYIYYIPIVNLINVIKLFLAMHKNSFYLTNVRRLFIIFKLVFLPAGFNAIRIFINMWIKDEKVLTVILWIFIYITLIMISYIADWERKRLLAYVKRKEDGE